MRGAIEVSNEEKILDRLEDVRADLATVKAKVDAIERDILFKDWKEQAPTREEQREAFHDLINSISDEDAEEFGRMVEEMERQKGGML